MASGYISLNNSTPRINFTRIFCWIFFIGVGIYLITNLSFTKQKSKVVNYKEKLGIQERLNNDQNKDEEQEGHPIHAHSGAVKEAKHYRHSEKNEFKPTNEWQIVPDDSVLPAGLEIDINFDTGIKRARLPPKGNAPAHDDLPAPKGNSERSEFHRVVKHQNIVEQRLDEVRSPNPEIQRLALDHLDVEAHRIHVGESITHAQNFRNLVELLADRDKGIRLEAAGIIAACLHSNKGAVEGALMSNLVQRIVELLDKETEAQVQRHFIAVLTYLAEGNLPGTLHRFNFTGGFAVLERILSRGLEPAVHTRACVFLATLAQESSNEHTYNTCMSLLDRNISNIHTRPDDVYMNSFRYVCDTLLGNGPESRRFLHVHKFCLKNSGHR